MILGIEYSDGHYVLEEYKEIPFGYPAADIPESVYGLYLAYKHSEREWQKYIRELDNKWHKDNSP